jgi:SAM-dependent methyltransferase
MRLALTARKDPAQTLRVFGLRLERRLRSVHVETARWTSEVLQAIDLPPGSRALDVGSSTLHYRAVEQPHIEERVMGPLREREIEITHLDAKRDPGVDIVCDLDRADEGMVSVLGEYELVLFAAVLHYVRDPDHVLDFVVRLLAPGGHLVAHHPEVARRSYDPIDNKLRLTPGELAERFERRGLERTRADSVRIDSGRYYRGLVSQPSWVPVAGRFWFPLPGFSERLRFRVPALRWRQSCVVMRRPRRT